MEHSPGQQLGTYRIIRFLGEGGFAAVYLGEHIHLGTMVAIKLLRTRLTSDDISSFRNEARTIAHLIHPHIVRVLDFDLEGGIPYLVMDYAPNGTLRQLHPKGQKLPLSTVVSYVKQVAEALQYAHDQKLIHRDIKPENMLLNRDNNILLSDFGIATIARSTIKQNTQTIAGTAEYMAPEMFTGKSYPASDQYSLGIVAYEWLRGQPPFNEGNFIQLGFQHKDSRPEPISQHVPTISKAVEEVLEIALAKDYKQRYENIRDFANALEKASTSGRIWNRRLPPNVDQEEDWELEVLPDLEEEEEEENWELEVPPATPQLLPPPLRKPRQPIRPHNAPLRKDNFLDDRPRTPARRRAVPRRHPRPAPRQPLRLDPSPVPDEDFVDDELPEFPIVRRLPSRTRSTPMPRSQSRHDPTPIPDEELWDDDLPDVDLSEPLPSRRPPYRPQPAKILQPRSRQDSTPALDEDIGDDDFLYINPLESNRPLSRLRPASVLRPRSKAGYAIRSSQQSSFGRFFLLALFIESVSIIGYYALAFMLNVNRLAITWIFLGIAVDFLAANFLEKKDYGCIVSLIILGISIFIASLTAILLNSLGVVGDFISIVIGASIFTGIINAWISNKSSR